jgi:hypothetical protein
VYKNYHYRLSIRVGNNKIDDIIDTIQSLTSGQKDRVVYSYV